MTNDATIGIPRRRQSPIKSTRKRMAPRRKHHSHVRNRTRLSLTLLYAGCARFLFLIQ
jgi:hypothetical protein